MVFLEVEMLWNILVPPDQLDTKGVLLHKAVILHLTENFATKKSSNEHGYFVAVTSLNKIGEGRIRDLTGDVLFPVTFKCLVQKPCKGEIMVGTVDKVLKHGIFLKSGPFDRIFLSEKKMGDYRCLWRKPNVHEREAVEAGEGRHCSVQGSRIPLERS